jgi:hypothetical protein
MTFSSYLEENIVFMTNSNSMNEKKLKTFESPDLTKMKEVIIDNRTKIYISLSADSEVARTRYLSRPGAKKL